MLLNCHDDNWLLIGLPGMGVVIQEMVDSQTAGVLFTVNPKDGDPSKMILTANYGLGESVVSANAEPDTFIVKRTSSGQLSVSEKTVGSKQLKIVLTEDGTRQLEVDASSSQLSCLSDEMVLQLAQLGLHLEQCFGGPRDIEFAIHNDRIHLLQVNTLLILIIITLFECQRSMNVNDLMNSWKSPGFLKDL